MSKPEKLSPELFKSPGAHYRGAPFWAWNSRMSNRQIDDVLEALHRMGMGGAHLHSRMGMSVPYLSDDFMERIRYTHQKASEKGMLTWLYDEDRCPSGAAGGLVTKDRAYRSRFLVFAPHPLRDGECPPDTQENMYGQAVRSADRSLLARYAVKLVAGKLEDYRLLAANHVLEPGFAEWYAYLEIAGGVPLHNGQPYLNNLDKTAVQRFIDVTYERYFNELGSEFGKTVPAIFTDEPQLTAKKCFSFPEQQISLTIPYTDDFEETYTNAYGESFLEKLPEIFWELPDDKASLARYRYHDHLCERFVSAFADTIGRWCETHGIMLTGHLMAEESLHGQTAMLGGDAMRFYRSFQLPGIDLLCDNVELSTAKQAQSAVRQYGRPGLTCELYGVTGWDFDFRGHKRQGDWLAALGVTTRVHHLTWTSMAGAAKRDYPASIGAQSPWHPEYPLIEDYFARLNTALTRGKSVVRVGIINPIESYWLHYGPITQTAAFRKKLEDRFKNLIDWLLFGFMDFDFISEASLPQLSDDNPVKDGKLRVGEMEYDVIVVPGCETIRATTLDRLDAFVRQHGKVVTLGETPQYIDARPADHLPAWMVPLPFRRDALLDALEDYRELDVLDQSGRRHRNMIYQMRQDGDGRWLFLSHVRKTGNPDLVSEENLQIVLRGGWRLTEFNALTGETEACRFMQKDGKTVILEDLYAHDSRLYYLEPANASTDSIANEKPDMNAPLPAPASVGLSGCWPVTLAEPNVFLLDQAEYRFDDSEWKPREEILRINNLFRSELGYPLQINNGVQPWADAQPLDEGHRLGLRYAIRCEEAVSEVRLAMESPENVSIWLNGIAIPTQPNGEYVDSDILTLPLPGLNRGTNTLELSIPYHSKTDAEAMYLLGDFGVRPEGADAVIIKPVRQLAFGDVANQGLPFYGGSLTYHVEADLPECHMTVAATRFRCPLLKIELDGHDAGRIAFSPYRLYCGAVKAGRHKLDITVFGNRANTFGPLHNCNETERWIGARAWRTTNDAWSYEYNLKPFGLLKAPIIYCY